MCAAALLGPVVAVVTPFRNDKLDLGAVASYVAWLWDRGVRTILVNGTTGEFFATTAQERHAVVTQCRRSFPGTTIAHVGAGAPADVISELRCVQPAADYLALITPYFFADPPLDGLLAYYRQILPHAQRPVLLYNFPRHTQAPLPPELVSQLAGEFSGVVGVKDSAKERTVTRAFAAAGMMVLLGDDGAAAAIAELGCHATVTGGGGPLAEVPVAIAHALRAGQPAEAARLQHVFDRWRAIKHRSGLAEIAFIKAALGERIPGFPQHVRPPLVAAAPAPAQQVRTQLRELLTSAGLQNAG